MKLKAGVIGLGVGRAHAESYQSYKDCELIAACDLEDHKLSDARRVFQNILFSKKADDILNHKDINVVSIASYDNFHYEQVIQAIEQNKHVFVEKPLCLKAEEARRIRQLLQEKPHLKISSNLILRKSPRFMRLKEEIQKKRFGDVFSIEGDYNYGRIQKITEGWRGELDFYSVVYGGGVHMIDLFHWLLDDRVEEVQAFGNKIATRGTQFRFNDFVTCLLKFRSGVIGKMSANFGCVMPHFHTLTLYGTQGTFRNEFEAGYFYASRKREEKPEKWEDPYPGVHKGDLIRSFLDSIQNGSSPEVTADDVFDAMSVCFAIEKAVHSNTTVKVDYL